MIFFVAIAFGTELTFEQAMLAAATSPEGRIATASGIAARADVRARGSWGNPEVSFDHEPFRDGVELALPIGLAPLALATGAGVEAAELRARIDTVAVGVAAGAAWLDARRAADHAAAAERDEELAARLATAAKAQVASGEWSPLDGVFARADAARALDRALGWAQEENRARGRLGVLVGEPVDALAEWPVVAAPPAPDATQTPAVLAADLEARAALASRLAARLALLPALEVRGGYAVGAAESGPTWGASIAIPLFAPGISTVRGASARAEQAVAQADLAELDGAAAIANVATELAVAERLAEAWDIPGLGSALDSTVRLYDAGEISLAEYIAQRDLAVQAVQNAIDARWRVARARLAGWELAGVLP